MRKRRGRLGSTLVLACAAALVLSLPARAAVPTAPAAEQDQKQPPRYRPPKVPPRSGDGPIAFDVGARSDRVRDAIDFPSGAEQEWTGSDGKVYLMKMDLELELAPDTGPGNAVVSGVVNGCGAIQVEVKVPRRGGRSRARWSTTGFLEGTRVGTLGPDGRARLRLANYLPDCSVEAGSGVLEWTFERFGDVRFRSATVMPSSQVERTSVRPAELHLELADSSVEAVRGGPFTIAFTLKNEGDLDANGASVKLSSAAPELKVIGRDLYRFDPFTGEVSGEFRVVGRKLGTYALRLEANSENANRPALRIVVPVNRFAARSGGGLPWLPLGLAAAALLAGAFFLRRAARSR